MIWGDLSTMGQVIEKFLPADFEAVKTMKKNLRQCKDEWLEVKPGRGGGTYMGHNTMRQILEHAVDGITYWDFEPVEQWKEEVYALNKNTGAWYFDGYVYHVKAYMFIPGIGHRSQYGCKVAVGGKDNQDSAYKAATSNAFTKCAAMFGVGEEIYTKVKVDVGQEEDQSYSNIQADPNYSVGQPDLHQQNQQQNWSQQNNWNQNPQQTMNTQQAMQQADYAVQNNTFEAPFENVPNNGAQQQNFQATEHPAAQQQNVQAVEYGAPVTQDTTPAQKTQSTPTTQPEVQGTNPWQEQGVIIELQRYAAHKGRLAIQDDNDMKMISFLRDFFNDGNANTSYLTPENIKGFNDHLEKISA